MISYLKTDSVAHAITELAGELLMHGEDVNVIANVGDEVRTKELQNVLIEFKPRFSNTFESDYRKLSDHIRVSEFLWYMSRIPNANVVAPYLPNWLKYTNDTEGSVASNYGHYWHKHMPDVIAELSRDKHSRRAVFNIYEANEAGKYVRDTPCTLSVSFNIRNNHLNMHCHMRSNDLWYGFPIDVFNNSQLHQMALNKLRDVYPELQMGTYLHQADSFHAYDSPAKSVETRLEEIANDKPTDYSLYIPEYIRLGNFWQTSRAWALNSVHEDVFDHFKQAFVTKSYES